MPTFISLVLGVVLNLHPLHVSVMEIKYDEKDRQLEIMARIFTDDLELGIREMLKRPELDILNPPSGESTDQWIGSYLEKHIKITLDQKPQKIKFLGTETEGPAMVCYIEVPSVKKWKGMEVLNDVLLEIHDDQSNIVHVNVRGEIKSHRLYKNNEKGIFSFDIN